MSLSWQAVVEKTVTGLGYEVVDCERSTGGLLRVFIDKPLVQQPGEDGQTAWQEPEVPVNVEDCERVTRQLRYVLEVEECDYQRLEVSTPGLDRPLNKPVDYVRFCGLEVEVTLREAFQGRKKYRGVLTTPDDSAPDFSAPRSDWRVIFTDGKQEQALDFSLDEVRSAKLVPEISFKGRPAAAPGGAQPAGKGPSADKLEKTGLAPEASKAAKATKKKSNAKTRQTDDKVDGGLDQ
ncbi:ribosome maturation factor RimP [Roseateles sp. YR242]|nr:ribosome maturation factor RimP [Roseateles sp. YR242]